MAADATVHVELCLRNTSPLAEDEASARVRALLEAQAITVYRDGPLDLASDEVLRSHALYAE